MSALNESRPPDIEITVVHDVNWAMIIPGHQMTVQNFSRFHVTMAFDY
jgi:hypothetical protein